MTARVTHQVRWVSGKGRYTTHSFTSLTAAQECKRLHEEYTGRPAHIVVLPAATGANWINSHEELMASLADRSLRHAPSWDRIA